MPSGGTGEVRLVETGRAKAYLLLGREPAWHDEFAAGEVRSYVRRMTGTELPLRRLGQPEDDESLVPVVIGAAASNEAVAALSKAGSLSLGSNELTHEGFVLKTTEWRDKPCLVLAGVSGVGTVYAAYDLLERFGRVGFFRYEEHVPRRSDFTVPDCDIRERPHFRVRMHGGQYHYFGIHWFGEEQWQENLRWCAKYRVNRQNYLPGPPVQYLSEGGWWKRLGVETAPKTDPRDRKPGDALAMVGRLTRLGIRLGLKAPHGGTDGQIPPAVVADFRRAHPDAKVLTITRNASTNTYLDPSDPLWLTLSQARIENAIEYFGDSKLYGLPSPWAERSPGETPDEKERLTREYAAALGRLAAWAEKEHPGAEWMMDCWAFANKTYWQPYRVERMLGSLPKDINLVLWGYPADDEPSYVYNSYWFGRPWAYIVMHSSAGNTTVHGDVRRLMGNTFSVLCDQRAYRMVGFGNYTEANDYAPFYKDLLLHMAWNPIRGLDDFVRDYCERRYDPRSVTAMVACHHKMLKSVYGPQSDTHLTDGFRTVRLQDPVYWFQLGGHWVPFDELQRRQVAMRRHWAPLLRDALADALSVAAHERGNAAYVRDLVDLMRSYVQVRINTSVWDAVEAAHRGDAGAFEAQYGRIVRLFDHLLKAIGLVAHRWEFGVNALIRDFEDAPLKYSPKEIRHFLYYVTWRGNQIHDYFRADRYEMIRDIHRPMTMAYLDACRREMSGQGSAQKGRGKDVWESRWEYGTIMDVEAVPAKAHRSIGPIQELVDDFVNEPCAPPPDPHDVADTAQSFLDAARSGGI